MSNDQIKIIVWLSGIDLEDAQRIQKPMSTFLKKFERVKAGNNPNNCRLSPCQKHQYARGVCSGHYRQLAAVSKAVGWSPLAALGLCKTSNLRDVAVSDERLRQKAKLQVRKGDLSSSERRLLGMTRRPSTTHHTRKP